MRFANRRSAMTERSLATPGAATSVAPRQPSALPAHVSATGRPLEPETRRFFEGRFSHDFSRVRVHADAAAAFSARTAGAAAYTFGTDIVFGAGMYRPDSPSGTRLLAHELAHVVQQDQRSGAAAPGADYESEAHAAAGRAARGERAPVTLAAPTGVQRQGLPGTPSTDLAESASPLLASAIGSVTLDGFETGKFGISPGNRGRLAQTADRMVKLFRQYPASTIRVIGYTDAVGLESDNQVLGQARADAVQAALLDMGISESAVHAESRGAGEPVVRSAKSEPRNRRVEVRFETSRTLRNAFSGGLTLTPRATATPPAITGGIPGVGNLCVTNPAVCYGAGQGFPGGPATVPNAALQPLKDDTPYNLMDVPGVNDAYRSHGDSPNAGGDLHATWKTLYDKYFYGWKLPKERAAQAANAELSGTAGRSESRANPNAADRTDNDMQQAYPNATKVGPASVKLFEF
jgi:outer membrane protein OmpA-like peptidoglycan-associated protein